MIILSALLLALAAHADPIEVTGPAIKDCEPTQSIEAHYTIRRQIPHDPNGHGHQNQFESVCEVVMKMNLKTDGTPCSHIPPGDRSCKFKLDGKPMEVYDRWR